MYELIQAGERTYYINSPAKVGLYRTGKGVILIDSGNDKDAGKKIQKILEKNGWELTAILNTHSNADHVGGNRFLQDYYHCPVYCSDVENAFIHCPELESAFLYGGFPCTELRNKFLMAKPSEAADISSASLPEGFEVIPLPGHFFGMVGYRTPDNILFLADCLVGENIVEKYHVSFLYDVRAYLETLDRVERMEASLYIPAHMPEPTREIRPAVGVNRKKVFEIIDFILEICIRPLSFEQILKGTFDRYQLTMDFNQYVLVGSTIRSYLSFLHDQGWISAEFMENRLLWAKAD